MSGTELPWKTVAFLADVFDAAASDLPAHQRRDLEQTEAGTLAEILTALGEICRDVRHFRSVDALVGAAPLLKEAVLLSTYGGPPSRNRLILAPAVAEALGIAFVGLDAMGQALAHDKSVMKRIAAECGLQTPRWRVLRDTEDLAVCREFPTPYVIKPLAEGSSIGISQRNLVQDPRLGVELAADLLLRFQQPVLLEAFAAGREASFVAIETHASPHTAFVEIAVAGQPAYFDTHLFDANEKLNRQLPRSVQLIDDALHPDDRTAIERLLREIGHYGYVRVDGKLLDGRFVFLELTPDAWLGRRGHVGAGFIAKGWTYPEVFKAILLSASAGNRGPRSNG